MQVLKSDRNANGYTKELGRLHGCAEESFERIAAGILYQQRWPPFIMHQLERSSSRNGVQLPSKRIGVLKSRNRFGPRLLQRWCLHKHLCGTGFSLTSEKDAFPISPE